MPIDRSNDAIGRQWLSAPECTVARASGRRQTDIQGDIRKMQQIISSTLLACGWAAASLCALAQQPYPGAPITLIVPFAAGSVTDAVGRNLPQTHDHSL